MGKLKPPKQITFDCNGGSSSVDGPARFGDEARTYTLTPQLLSTQKWSQGYVFLTTRISGKRALRPNVVCWTDYGFDTIPTP